MNLGLSQECKSLQNKLHIYRQCNVYRFHSETKKIPKRIFKDFITLVLSLTVVDEIWQQQATLRLLQLIELPLLESLLEGKESPRPPLHGMDSDPDLLYTSNYVDREILKAFSEAQ